MDTGSVTLVAIFTALLLLLSFVPLSEGEYQNAKAQAL
jgi:hypothetical protein